MSLSDLARVIDATNRNLRPDFDTRDREGERVTNITIQRNAFDQEKKKAVTEFVGELFEAPPDPEPSTANLGPVSQADDMMPGQLRTADAALRFILAGNAYFTVRSKKTGTRYTFRVAIPAWAKKANRLMYYVSLLNGPDNEHNYTYLGTIADDRIYRRSPKSKVTSQAESHKAFSWMMERLQAGRLPENIEIWHEGRCGRCGRKLTVPESTAAGIGPECAGRM